MTIRDKIINFQYKNRSFAVSLSYSPRKTLGISVNPDQTIKVTAPFNTPSEHVQRAVQRKAKWITRKLEELEKYQSMKKTREYVSGHTLKLLGLDYMIKIIQIQDFEEEQIVKEKKLIKVYVYNKNQKRRINLLIEDWYRNEALVYLAQKFEQCYERVKKYDISKPPYYLHYMSQRWGSCTAKGAILLNPEIIQLPAHCIEYVIMHELCHLKYRTHSKEFYRFLDTVLPNWTDYSQALDSFLQV